MTVKDLIEKLQKMPEHLQVMFSDSIAPITIDGIGQNKITQDHADNSADCEDRAGETVCLLYGL